MTRSRRRLMGTAAVILLLAGSAYGVLRISKARCFQLVGTPICAVKTDEKLVALSFDDGPTRQGVDAVLPVLARYDARATFFVVGQEIERSPGEVRRLVAAGHEIGNHSFSHSRMWGLLPGPYESEIRRTDALIRNEGGAPTLFRPPYGMRLTGVPIAVARTGYRTAMWSFEDAMDEKDPQVVARRILDAVHPGAILILHVMYRTGQPERDALPLILEGLKARGYRAVGVSELLAHED